VDLYIDDCIDNDWLAAALARAGHRVVTPRSVGTRGIRDPRHLEHATANGLVLLTRNPTDFDELHKEWQAQGRAHSGILVVCMDNIKGKDMSPADVVRAIANLVASGLPVANEIHVLNHWR
jgi:hypothetical protein